MWRISWIVVGGAHPDGRKIPGVQRRAEKKWLLTIILRSGLPLVPDILISQYQAFSITGVSQIRFCARVSLAWLPYPIVSYKEVAAWL
jgi:hypothetical protein